MSRVTIETNGSVIANTLRDHLLAEEQEIKAELAKAAAAQVELTDRLKFIEALKGACNSHGIDLRDQTVQAAPKASTEASA